MTMPKKNWEKHKSSEHNDAKRYIDRDVYTESAVELMNTMRSLWEQHVAWTRMTIISVANNLPDQELVTRRLLRNAVDMGNALRPLYGARVANEYAGLIREHLLIANELVAAAKAGDRRAAAAAERRWYANADEIAAFLNSINPNLSEAALREMLHEHLALTKDEATAILTGRFARGIALYDRIEEQALEMADAISAGIIKQFPKVFSCEVDD
jgi:hypothetical protein